MTGQVHIATHKASPGERLRRALKFARDFLLPPVCPACREPVTGTGGLCARCWAKLSFIARPYCERLGTPFAHDMGQGTLSIRAIADPPAYGRARAAVRYDDIARALVHALKYGDRLELAPTMGRWMAQAGGELLADADAIVPVPLHWRRLWTRRFNQAALLAQALSQSCGLPVWHAALRRVRATPQQVGLARAERASNVQAAFRVPEQAKAMIRGKRIVLVDDVLTSGATVDTCARALFRGGALGVDVVVFACVVDATL
ncbi:MAG: ComF family protein [Rhodoplanes sp.]|jgi:ComF family protein